jgi:hypothetical protein
VHQGPQAQRLRPLVKAAARVVESRGRGHGEKVILGTDFCVWVCPLSPRGGFFGSPFRL